MRFAIFFLLLAMAGSHKPIITRSYFSQVDTAYLSKAAAFIMQVKKAELLKHGILLDDKPVTLESAGCLNEVLADSVMFTTKELNDLRHNQYKGFDAWSQSRFSGITTIPHATIDSIFSNHGAGWEYFYNKIGPQFYSFSSPVFLRNGAYCLFYSAIHCGYLCGYGSVILYKKEAEGWKEVKTYCSWIS